MPGVRKVLSQNIQNLPNLSMKQTLKVAARFVQRRPEEMQRVFDKAKARKEVPVAVYEAIQRLWKNQGIANSYDLNFLETLLAEVTRDEQQKQSGRVLDSDFRAAAHDEAFKATVGSPKNNLAIRLKNRIRGGIPRPAKTDLKADLRELAKAGEWKKYHAATKLAALLDAVNKCPTRQGSDEPLTDELNQILETHRQAVIALWPDTDDDDVCSNEFQNAHRSTLANRGTFSDFIGTALTTLLRPEKVARYKARTVAPAVVGKLLADGVLDRLKKMGVEPNSQDAYVAVLFASRRAVVAQGSDLTSEMETELQKESSKATFGKHGIAPAELVSEVGHDRFGGVTARQVQTALTDTTDLPADWVSGEQLLKLIGKNFEVFSGPISIHFEGASLREYFELGCAIHVLDNTTGKEIELLRSFLKDEEIPAKDEERDPLVEFLFGNSSDQLRTEVPRFNLESRSGMIEEIYYHFFVREGKAANLYGDKLKGFENKFNAAQDEGAKIEALKEGFSRLLENNPLEKSRIVAILEDLALLRAAVW